MSEYLLDHGTRETPQSETMRDDQVANSAGGFTWELDSWGRLRRFLILGSEGGSYYATERELTLGNVASVRECVRQDGQRLVAEVVEVSEAGRAPQNDAALYALASAISLGDRETKRAAAEALPRVARIGTHLYRFVSYAETMRGWGPTLRWAVSNWFSSKLPDDLAYQAVKYRTREGVAYRDLLRLAHPSGSLARGRGSSRRLDPELRDVLGFMSSNVGHDLGVDEQGRANVAVESWEPGDDTPRVIEGFLRAQLASSPIETAKLVREYRLPREALKTEHLTDPEVWTAMLETGMPLTAMVRNLATMTRNGTLDSRDNVRLVTKALDDADAIRGARVHPLALLVAQRTYASGHGFRGTNSWIPKPDVIDALDAGFYLAFDNVEATGQRYLLALDVSGSMASGQVAGSPLSPREAAVAMALVSLHAETDVEVIGFTGGLVQLPISRRQRLDDAVRLVRNLPFDRTDCARPMLYALHEGREIDAFVVYTDSETWCGSIHPKQALDRYREASGIPSRSAVVGMVSNGFTIADPHDRGMMDCCGFDTSTPSVISDFSAGLI